MPSFSYRVLTPQGTVESATRDAASEQELEEEIRARGHYLVSIEPAAAAAAAPPGPARSRPTDGAVPRLELLAFTEYLGAGIRAGIPILTTLHDVEAHLTSRRMRRIVREIQASMLHEGKPLSEALAEHPKAFPQLFVRTVEAGEATGQLDFVLEQLARHLEWQQEISLQIRQISVYPLIVLSAAFALVMVLVIFVYPRLMPVFTSFDIEIPLPTQIVMVVGGFLRDRWQWILGAVAAGIVAVLLAGRTERGRWLLDTVRLRVPVLGRLRHELEMARLVTYLSLFYRTGIDLLRSLELLEQIMTNRRIAAAVHQAREAIHRGESLSRAFESTGIFPVIVIRSIALGESTGKLDETLDRARAYYAREGPAAVRRLLAVMQPVLVVSLGALIMLVALSIFLPIMQIYQSIGP